MASVRDLGKYSANRGISYIILCLECYPKCLKNSFKSITGVHASTIYHSVFFIVAGFIVEMLFMLFSIYNAV